MNNEGTKPPVAMIEFYKEVEKLINRWTEEDNVKEIFDADGTVDRVLASGQSLSEGGLVSIDGAKALNYFKVLVSLLHQDPDNRLAVALQEALIKEQIRASFLQDSRPVRDEQILDWAANSELEPHSLLRLIHLVWSPFWRQTAKNYRSKLNEHPWHKGVCPICGRLPNLAILDEAKHGRRYLVCLSCDWKWAYTRIECPVCENDDHDSVGYTLVEEITRYKVFHCEKCNSYLKTIDQRAKGYPLAETLLMEDIQTLFLDLIATQRDLLPMR